MVRFQFVVAFAMNETASGIGSVPGIPCHPRSRQIALYFSIFTHPLVKMQILDQVHFQDSDGRFWEMQEVLPLIHLNSFISNFYLH